MIRRALIACVVGAALLSSPVPAAAETHQISIAQYAYQATSMTVRPGDVVTWTNQDEAPHDVVTTEGPESFRSPMLSTGQSWSFTFTEPGTYSYYCSVHPDMRAQIVVLPAETTQAPPPPPAAVAPQQEAPAQETAQQPEQVPMTGPAPTSAAAPVLAAPLPPAPRPPLDPMLLLAGLVAAVTTLCLLLIGSRPDNG